MQEASPLPELPSQQYYQKVLFGALQSEQEYYAERARFAQVISESTHGTISPEQGEQIYDTRKILMSLQARYAGGEQVSRDDFHRTLELGRKLLEHENVEGFIPFIIRTRETSDINAIKHHPRWYLEDLIVQRFMNPEEFTPYLESESPHVFASDISQALDFCLRIHVWNTQYYHRYPTVGVLFSEDAPERKKFRAGEQANHLVWWRGIPFEICGSLIELGLLDRLDTRLRSSYLEKLVEMCVDELFDESYFGHSGRPPHIPRYMEFPPRTGPAEQLLRMIVGIYGQEGALIGMRDRLLANNYQQYSSTQQEKLKRIFFGEEEDLV